MRRLDFTITALALAVVVIDVVGHDAFGAAVWGVVFGARLTIVARAWRAQEDRWRVTRGSDD